MYLRNVEELIIYSLQNQSQYVEIKISFLIISHFIHQSDSVKTKKVNWKSHNTVWTLFVLEFRTWPKILREISALHIMRKWDLEA